MIGKTSLNFAVFHKVEDKLVKTSSYWVALYEVMLQPQLCCIMCGSTLKTHSHTDNCPLFSFFLTNEISHEISFMSVCLSSAAVRAAPFIK